MRSGWWPIVVGLAVVVLCSLGCAGLPVSLAPMSDDLVRAERDVWEFMGRKGQPMPYVQLVTKLTCRNSPGVEMTGFGGSREGVLTDGSCKDGWEPTPAYLYVKRVPASTPWSQTALAHELMHVDQALRGISDLGHAIVGDWEQGTVGAANRMLAARGE